MPQVSVQAQTPARESVTKPATTALWVGLYTKMRISEKAFIYGETHYRRKNSLDNRKDFVGRMGQSYNRLGINVLFNPYFELTAGPCVVFNFTPEPGNPAFEKVVIEPRFWHQWLFVQPYMGRVKMYHQFRFEHRFKRSNALDAKFEYTNRYRYKLFAYIPINKPRIENHAFFFSPSGEIFLHSGKSIVYHPMEDFRVYTAVGYIHNNLMFFGGHMWTLGQDRSGFEFNQSHVIRLNLFVTLDLRKKQKLDPEARIGMMREDPWTTGSLWN